MNRADGALLVVRSRKTRYALIDRLLDQIPAEKMLGVILNRVDEQLDEANYYYQRRYFNADREPAAAGVRHLPGERQEEAAVAN
jgi:hypothetical protein